MYEFVTFSLTVGVLAFIGLIAVALVAVVVVYVVAPGTFGIGAHDAITALFCLLAMAAWWAGSVK